MSRTIDTLLLLALPASGKSEVRKYMDSLDPERSRDELHMGRTVQLDDFPYVHLMHRIDDELKQAGGEYLFYQGPDKPARDPIFWGILVALLNEDYDDLVHRRHFEPHSAARWLFERLDSARIRARGDTVLDKLDPAVLDKAIAALEPECRTLLDDKLANYQDSLEDKTVVIEFARGGPDGSDMPLTGYLGYQYALAHLSEDILKNAAILYIWVTPEESRRKNADRADPDDPGSILHHGVPMEVMLGDYGCDDIDHLIASSDKPGTIRVEAHGKVFHLPIGRFDNRVDKTSFLRGDPSEWAEADVKAIHEGIAGAMAQIAENYGKA